MQAGITAGRRYPMDNVQRFEQVRNDAEFLQMMADFEEPADEVNALTGELVPIELLGLPVVIKGGRMEMPAIGDDDTATMVMVPNEEATGHYKGAHWRKAESLLDTNKAAWYLCHKLYQGSSQLVNDEGDDVRIDHNVYVTVTDSDVSINAAESSHDFRVLHDDGFTLKIDQLVLDDELSAHERLEMIARMVGRMSTDADPESLNLLRQRLSYINYLGVFDDCICVAPIAYYRDGSDELRMITTPDQRLIAPIRLVGMDAPYDVTNDGVLEMDQSQHVLSLEVEIEGYGLCSVPFSPDRTQILQVITVSE